MLDRLIRFLATWFAADAGRGALPSAGQNAPGAPGAVPSLLDVENARQVLHRVSEVTTAVANDVGQHQYRIRGVSSELAAVAQGDAQAVGELVCRLLAANQDLQGRLERAELKLQVHTRQLQDVTVVARTD